VQTPAALDAVTDFLLREGVRSRQVWRCTARYV
jgi:hypothetical protein